MAILVLVALVCMAATGVKLRRASVAQPQGVTVHQVRPSQTDPALTDPDNANLAVVGPRTRQNGLLLVFLPGTGGKPSCCQLYLRQAVALGYRAIGLTYNNQTAVGTRCLNDLSCYGTVRQNVFDGEDGSVYSSLPPRDGVEHRLVALLRYLAARYPREGWGQFLARGAPRWRMIVLSGHSQGGGEAAFIGIQRSLRGVVTLSSPPDTNDAYQPATWVSQVNQGRTAIGRVVGFVHSGDPFYARIAADWTAMGLPSLGPLTLVDGTNPPYGTSHQLISSAPLPPVVLASHDSTAVDSATPLCPNGSPRYAPVWSYMLETAGALPLTPASTC